MAKTREELIRETQKIAGDEFTGAAGSVWDHFHGDDDALVLRDESEEVSGYDPCDPDRYWSEKTSFAASTANVAVDIITSPFKLIKLFF